MLDSQVGGNGPCERDATLSHSLQADIEQWPIGRQKQPTSACLLLGRALKRMFIPMHSAPQAIRCHFSLCSCMKLLLTLICALSFSSLFLFFFLSFLIFHSFPLLSPICAAFLFHFLAFATSFFAHTRTTHQRHLLSLKDTTATRTTTLLLKTILIHVWKTKDSLYLGL